ncbi:MAG: hypothetical protein AAF741_05690 [Bacteroidota bacterium]
MHKFIFPTLVLLAHISLSAQDVVDEQLTDYQFTAESDGYEQILATKYVWLNDDETDHYGLKLVAGRTYRIVGACDQDCTDMDLFLYGDETIGSLLESDDLEDNFPIIDFTPTETKTYRIKMGMYDCATEPCQVGVDVFRLTDK